MSKYTQTYQLKVVILIKHQILVTNLEVNLWQLDGRISNQIFRVIELTEKLLNALVLTLVCFQRSCVSSARVFARSSVFRKHLENT